MTTEIKIGDQVIPARLDNSPAAQAFADQLPLKLTLSDFGNGTEKIADLPKRLPTDGSPEGITPESGVIAYYAPWGNLAIFRKDFRYSEGLVKLGAFTQDFAAVDRDGEIQVTIQPVDP